MPRTLFGVARTLDLGAQFDWYNYSPTDEDADARAIYADWTAVGDDLARASEKNFPMTPRADETEEFRTHA
jgi:hypothetical protein